MAIAELIGRLCETLRISKINCVSNCCNVRRSKSPDPGDTVPVAVQTKHSGRDQQIVEEGEKTEHGSEKGGRQIVFADPVGLHTTQTSDKKIQKKKSRLTKTAYIISTLLTCKNLRTTTMAINTS